MALRDVTALALGLLLAACGPSIEDPPYEPDVERLCAEQCEAYLDCGGNAFTDAEACRASCEDREFWESSCNREYEVEIECRADLTCSELGDYESSAQTAGPPAETLPCWESESEFATCVGDNR